MSVAKIFKALSDETRLAIFELLRARCPKGCHLADEQVGQSVSEIGAHFQLALPTVSHHLKELRNAELIRCEKRGRWVYCAPNQAALDEIDKFVNPSDE